MNILVTAGNTLVPIDRVRCLTNIFTGRTGAKIAMVAHERGHKVQLLTSRPEAVREVYGQEWLANADWDVVRYRTFEELRDAMQAAVQRPGFDVVIHCAAVSDYLSAGVYAPGPGTRFDAEKGAWRSEAGDPTLVDRRAEKVKSDEPELWLRLTRAPKLIDLVRSTWNFRGILVKFKLEVGVSEERLLEIAEASRQHSQADLIVANTLEGSDSWAYVGPIQGRYRRVERHELADRLLDAIDHKPTERTHG
ncbi:bifunctional phosphopantothenoylcysteine decarboxylase/phosphopantothenate synthase [Planctomycetaceae bacterium SCGC AG-212-D15]|nr:bifunctional phosphopantothenoylcysteine decarboxylase/phosphopantothenate synthase [Planctomycetaceae bacterium SCGC AG-212-D15]